VEHDRIHAKPENGVSRVTVPRSERAKPRRIEIGGNSGAQEVETRGDV
jgi:HSP20 family molecular chaperone IbpA